MYDHKIKDGMNLTILNLIIVMLEGELESEHLDDSLYGSRESGVFMCGENYNDDSDRNL